jgi:uncharacterized protein (DUF2147 family)
VTFLADFLPFSLERFEKSAAPNSVFPFAALFAVLASCGAAEATPPDPAGLWSTKDDESIIEIAPCGPNYCGFLVWLRDPNDTAGKPKTDQSNEDETMRERPLLGIPLLIDLTADKNLWRGKAYNPEDGKTYEITFKPAPGKTVGDKAEIRGCVLKIFCKSETFTRVESLPGGAAPAATAEKPKTGGRPRANKP